MSSLLQEVPPDYSALSLTEAVRGLWRFAMGRSLSLGRWEPSFLPHPLLLPDGPKRGWQSISAARKVLALVMCWFQQADGVTNQGRAAEVHMLSSLMYRLLLPFFDFYFHLVWWLALSDTEESPGRSVLLRGCLFRKPCFQRKPPCCIGWPRLRKVKVVCNQVVANIPQLKPFWLQ